MTVEKYKELKKKAIDADITLSDYLSTAGTITPIEQVKLANTPISEPDAQTVTPKKNDR